MSTTPIWDAPPRAGTLLPIGGGYADLYAGFAETVVAAACAARAPASAVFDGRVNIVVLPTAYSTSAEKITGEERGRNLRDAERRRRQIEMACRRACERVAPAGLAFCVTVAPIFTRSDAADPAKVAPLLGPVSAVFMLGGDQAVAMAALAGTPVEVALAAAHECGAVIAGTSAGAAMLAWGMLAGYNPDFSAGNALDVGAAEVWNTGGRRGLAFGVQGALLDQHFFQRGRLGRLLNAITTSGAMAPTLGIGIDAYTAAHIYQGSATEDGATGDPDPPGGRASDRRPVAARTPVRPTPGRRVLGDVFGLYEVAILDAGTYHSAETARHTPLEDPACPPVLSLRNILVHLLAPGSFSYDLDERRCSLGAPQTELVRDFEDLRLPSGAGALLLAGDLGDALPNDPVLARFRELAGGPAAKVLVYADAYAWDRSARMAGERLAAQLGLDACVLTASDLAGGRLTLDAAGLAGYTAIALAGRDQSLVDVGRLAAWLPAAWRSGLPVLADNALAPALGAYYSAHGPTPVGREEAEDATQRSFLAGGTVIKPGLALLPATFEPQLLADNRWGRYFSLAYTHPELVAIGLNRGAAIEIGPDGAWALGGNVTFTLDLRAARLALGTNRGFVIANGLLDVFAPGDEVRPQLARGSYRSDDLHRHDPADVRRSARQ